jgi:hypothetical protein
MLQKISGKFFQTDNLYKSNETAVIYSNYDWMFPIETDLFYLKPINSRMGSFPYTYTLFYENKNEINPDRSGLIQYGDGEIVKHIKILLTFYFSAFFDVEKFTLEDLCYPTLIHNYQTPSKYIDRIFEPRIHANKEEVDGFSLFVRKIIGLPREKYKLVIKCIEAYYQSLYILNYNFDMAYSLLVFALETITQELDEFKGQWSDYPNHEKLDKVINTLDLSIQNKIKEIILENSHLKLLHRFKKYIKSNLSDSFFLTDNSTQVVRISEIDLLLENVYKTRSQFAHELKSTIEHIKWEKLAETDVLRLSDTMVFTYRGLSHLTHHVLLNTINNGDFLETEVYDWRSDIPGQISMPCSHRLWINECRNFNDRSVIPRLSVFTNEIASFFLNKELLSNCKDLMNLYETKIPSIARKYKTTMFTHYYLYNSVLPEEERCPHFNELCKSVSDLDKDTIKYLLMELITLQVPKQTPSKLFEIYQKYEKRRNKYKGVIIHPLFEIGIQLLIAIKFHESGYYQEYKERMKYLLLDSCIIPRCQKYIKGFLNTEDLPNIRDFFDIVQKNN